MGQRDTLPFSPFRSRVKTSRRRLLFLTVKELGKTGLVETYGPSYRARQANSGIQAWPRQAPPLGRRKRPDLASQAWACPQGRTRVHGMLGKLPRGGHFVLSAPFRRRLFWPASEQKRLATVSLALSSVGARAGGSSRPRKAP